MRANHMYLFFVCSKKQKEKKIRKRKEKEKK